MAFAVTGFSTVAQNFISRQIASNFYKKAPFLSVLGALTIGNNNKDSLEIGRPNSGEILTGGIISPLERKRLGSVNSYLPRVQLFETTNSAYRQGSGHDGRTSLPAATNYNANASHGEAMQGAAEYRWCHLDTPVVIWHEDKIRAAKEGTAEGQAIAMGQIVDEATEIGMQDHLKKLATDIWDGSLTQTQQGYALWPNPHGILEIVAATGYMARVDRSTETLWQAKVNSTLKPVDIRKIIDDANYTQGLKIYGSGADLLMCGTTLYQQFKAQILAQGGTVLLNGLPAMAKMGVRKELLQIDNTLVMYDPFITDVNTVVAFDTTTWKFMIHPDFNFKVGKFINNAETGLNKELFDFAYISTRFMFTCDNPRLNVKYTAVGT
jgi:hypothetical protein